MSLDELERATAVLADQRAVHHDEVEQLKAELADLRLGKLKVRFDA